MTMLKMLSLAGGPTSTAKIEKAVILRKNLGYRASGIRCPLI